MRTVYAVSSGFYSDYRVLFLCEDRAEAERYVKLANHPHGYGEHQVEEFVLHDAGETPRQTLTYLVRISPGDHDVRVYEEYVTGDAAPIMSAVTYGPFESFRPDRPPHWTVEVRGTDRDRVIKAAIDREAKVKAEAEGIA